MDDLKQIARSLNLNLIEYTNIHDEIFKITLRKIIPIPFIFKRINFLELEINLNEILKCFSRYKIFVSVFIFAKKEDENRCKIFLEYLQRLNTAVTLLLEIVHNLLLKSQSKKEFSYKEHKQLCKEYIQSVNFYVSMGDEMNSIFA